jgi:hypothetical protein
VRPGADRTGRRLPRRIVRARPDGSTAALTVLAAARAWRRPAKRGQAHPQPAHGRCATGGHDATMAT